MPSFEDHGRDGLTLGDNRLETPSMAGYRRGMSSSGVIGRRLGSMYGIEPDLPREIDLALRQLDSRVGRVA